MITETCENQFDAMSQKLTTQELRITQRALEEMKKEYEQLKVREQSLMETTRWERGRSKAHEELATSLQAEVDKLQDEKEVLAKQVDKLTKENATLRNQATEGKLRNHMEHEIIDYRTKIAGLESKLSRRQIEFERSEENLRNEIDRLQSMVDATQMRLMNDSYGKESSKENFNSSNVEELNQLHYKMGALTARNDTLKEEITRYLAEKADFEHEINCLKEEVDASKRMIQNLQEMLAENEGFNDSISKMHSEEMNRVKNQKAEIRCELLRLKKEHQKLMQDIEDGVVGPDVTKLESEINELKKQSHDQQIKLEEAERLLAETESTKKGEIEQLKLDLLHATEEMSTMKQIMKVMDEEAESSLKKLQKEVKNKLEAREQIEELKKELSNLQSQINDKNGLEEELAAIKSENEKLLDKIAYLENEIKETHTDHREELAKLAKQLNANRTNTISLEMRQKEELSKKVTELEAELRQNELTVRSLHRQVEQSKAEVHSAEKALSDMREKQKSIVAENTDLRKALSDAIGKIKSANEKVESLTTTINEQKEEIERLQERQNQLYDQVSELREELQQKDDNIAYLQSIVQPKKLEKLKIVNSQSTLVTGPDDEAEIELLQRKRSELAREVAEKAKALQQKKEQIVPLVKADSVCSGSSFENRNESLNGSRSRIGTMRHDIPHRWSKLFVMVMTPRCESCYESIPKFSHYLRCKSCGLVVHQHCQSSVLNTCGLPAACANFYVDHHTVPDDKMSGWVKIWKSCDTPGTKWCNAYASLEGNILSFYETDVALAQHDAPVLKVDLSQERWKIYSQTGKPIKGIESKNADCLIEIKLRNMSLFMLTRTPEAKKSWIQALQSATDRKILERNNSNRRIMSMSIVLRLERPLLKFQCTEIYDDWLLIGTPQGLFVTSFAQPRMPFQVAGLSNVSQLKLIRDHNLLFAIDGVERNVVVIHTRQLDVAFNSGHAPSVQPTTYSNLAAAHLIEASEIHHCKERYLYVATADGITVFHYMPKKDMFVPSVDIKLEVPAMCLLSCPDGFVFGSDSYFFVRAGGWNPSSFEASWPPDLPVGVVKISDNEVLVVNHNSGVFTTPQGQRTREGLIDWVRIPVSVTYIEPYLFIVYTNTISVVRVLPHDEAQDKGILVEELEGYRAPTARVTGFGKTNSDVLVTVMNDNCVELNCFSLKNHLKRKTTSSTSYTQQPNKRRF
uniref:Non-specific serine/threonine protein kinase n=1 Tax=Panagrolaimus sp. JU765 TaxID=591449 RepID=A0AC34QUF5_9BILA